MIDVVKKLLLTWSKICSVSTKHQCGEAEARIIE